MDVAIKILLAVIGILLIIAFIKILSAPLRLVFKLLANTAIGFLAIIIINYAGKFTGLYLGLNFINALVIGVFGLPGAVLLLLLKWILVF